MDALKSLGVAYRRNLTDTEPGVGLDAVSVCIVARAVFSYVCGSRVGVMCLHAMRPMP